MTTTIDLPTTQPDVILFMSATIHALPGDIQILGAFGPNRHGPALAAVIGDLAKPRGVSVYRANGINACMPKRGHVPSMLHKYGLTELYNGLQFECFGTVAIQRVVLDFVRIHHSGVEWAMGCARRDASALGGPTPDLILHGFVARRCIAFAASMGPKPWPKWLGADSAVPASDASRLPGTGR